MAWKCNNCGGEIVASIADKKVYRLKESGEIDFSCKIATESETVRECKKCKQKARKPEEIATWIEK